MHRAQAQQPALVPVAVEEQIHGQADDCRCAHF